MIQQVETIPPNEDAVVETLRHVEREHGTPKWDYKEAFCRNLGLIDEEEQEKLRNSRVAIAGMGGVGGIHLITLARLGIGKFTIADFDTFEIANFNRQYGAMDDTIGQPKVAILAEDARRVNPELDLQVLPDGVQPDTIDEFLDGADLLVDGIDFFAIEMRRRIYQRAAELRIPAIMAAPMGFGTAWLVFDPDGMPFDRYFDLHDNQSELEQLIAFTVGLAPAGLHVPYMDLNFVNLAEKYGPSTGLACQLCAGVAAAEAVKILLRRGRIRCVPHYLQFDSYRAIFRRGRVWRGNRNVIQQLKRWYLKRQLKAMTSR